jgi:hypothetical protein
MFRSKGHCGDNIFIKCNKFIRESRRGSGASVLVFHNPFRPKSRYRARPKWGEFPENQNLKIKYIARIIITIREGRGEGAGVQVLLGVNMILYGQ